MKWPIYNEVHSAGFFFFFLGFRFPSFRKLENQWKPVETRKLFCLFTDAATYVSSLNVTHPMTTGIPSNLHGQKFATACYFFSEIKSFGSWKVIE